MLRIGDAGERTRITGSPYLPHIRIDGEYYASLVFDRFKP